MNMVNIKHGPNYKREKEDNSFTLMKNVIKSVIVSREIQYDVQ